MTKQNLSAPIPHTQLELLKNAYNRPGRSLSKTDGTTLKSFKFPVQIVHDLEAQNAAEVYFAFGYRTPDSSAEGVEGITIIVMGIDGQNEAMLDTDHVMYDVHNSNTSAGTKRNVTNTELNELLADFRNGSFSQPETTAEEHDGDSNTYILKGLRLDMEHLIAFKVRDNEVHFIECALGFHEEYSEKNHQKGHTFAVLGNDASGNRLIATGSNPEDYSEDLDKIFDYCDPCPRVCPNFFE